MTQYGSETILPYNKEEQKGTQVKRMFDSIAETYDQLNHTPVSYTHLSMRQGRLPIYFQSLGFASKSPTLAIKPSFVKSITTILLYILIYNITKISMNRLRYFLYFRGIVLTTDRMLTLDKIYQASYALKTVIRRTDLISAPNINPESHIDVYKRQDLSYSHV